MCTAIAIWNYCWDAAKVVPGIHVFADLGFEAVSLNPGQFHQGGSRVLPEVGKALLERGLAATVHGRVGMAPDLMREMIDAIGESLRVFSLDSRKTEDSRGVLHDAGRIRSALEELQELTSGTDIRLAVEDFPLDREALEFFGEELGDVYRHRRTGILVDVGHMHIRMRNSDYFSEMSVEEYFRRLPLTPVEVHLHDNDGRRDQHGHFGFGDVPFGEVAAALAAIDFGGISTIEIAPGFHGSTPEDSRPEAERSLREWRRLNGEV